MTLSSAAPRRCHGSGTLHLRRGAGRNSLRGPGYASFDLAVSKRIEARGRTAFTVGLQVFNLFDRTNFELPEHFADEPTTFGKILSAKAPRQLQLTARMAF